jgi:hypothetical protein
MLILAGLWVQQKIPAHIGDFFVFHLLKRGVYWQASHSASSFGSIGQVIGLSQSSLLIAPLFLAVSGILVTLLFLFCVYVIYISEA